MSPSIKNISLLRLSSDAMLNLKHLIIIIIVMLIKINKFVSAVHARVWTTIN